MFNNSTESDQIVVPVTPLEVRGDVAATAFDMMEASSNPAEIASIVRAHIALDKMLSRIKGTIGIRFSFNNND